MRNYRLRFDARRNEKWNRHALVGFGRRGIDPVKETHEELSGFLSHVVFPARLRGVHVETCPRPEVPALILPEVTRISSAGVDCASFGDLRPQ